jgi:hypothetical protein
MELPEHVDRRLREEFGSELKSPKDAEIHALYVTAEDPEHTSGYIGRANFRGNKIDVFYVTRFQKERWPDQHHDYPKITAEFLKAPKYSKTSVLHPLPRVDELDLALDSDARAIYFQQAAYGVPVRMALIASMLGLDVATPLARHPGGFQAPKYPIYDQPRDFGIECPNLNCIVRDDVEKPYTRNRFYVVANPDRTKVRLRCGYCETEVDDFVVADRFGNTFSRDSRTLLVDGAKLPDEIVIFPSDAAAVEGGYRASA